MGLLYMFWFIFVILGNLLRFQLSQSANVLVDGVSEWKHSTVQIGDTIVFQHKYQYNLYIFQNQNAFTLCNFTEATLLTKSNSKSYAWDPSRRGIFYFSFNNGSTNAASCLQGQKLAIKVSLSPELSPAAAPPFISGSIVSSSPAYTWPLPPRETASPANSPMVPQKGSDIPFIYSNPAVPLPTGEVDSATVHHLPTSGHHVTQVVKFVAIQSSLCCAISLMLF
ncbi:PREDICTED: uncharacterized protein LOC109242562 isoform X2 [Nicotiana attenuata]|uniref:uncharacterized protein LOC109242562 isoform X2 n=1 Tax=Nicotiana attenuata TaxID=49451 RepID=UPI0009049328|nr:PREDICTED: uncharacterized protein LOC109242562 isoform X2 [Nicotiana attenuata]